MKYSINSKKLFCRLTDEEKHFLDKAVALAKQAYGNKKRINKEPWFDHAERVASILVDEWKLHKIPVEFLAATYLKNSLDAQRTEKRLAKEEITLALGKKVTDIVLELQRRKNEGAIITRGVLSGKSLRKQLLDNLPVAIIRIADFIDVARQIQDLSPNEQRDLANSLYKVYIPYCKQLSLLLAEVELKKFAMQILEPDNFKRVEAMFLEYEKHRNGLLEEHCNYIREQMLEADEYDMQEALLADDIAKIDIIKVDHAEALNQLEADEKVQPEKIQLGLLCRFKVIVRKEQHCLIALNKLKMNRDLILLEEHDYIADPKTNGYQGLVATFGITGGRQRPIFDTFTVIIRTEEMDWIAELGAASQWRGVRPNHLAKKWRSSPSQDASDQDWQHKKRAITKSGDIKYLDKEATVLDFAYSIHTEIGHRFEKALVNGQEVPKSYQFEDQDIVEIVRSNHAKAPGDDWQDCVNIEEYKKEIQLYRRRNTHLQLFIRTHDRPGLIKDISETIYDFGLAFNKYFAFSHRGYGFFIIDILEVPKHSINLLKVMLLRIPSVIIATDRLEDMQPYKFLAVFSEVAKETLDHIENKEAQKWLGLETPGLDPAMLSDDLKRIFLLIENRPLELRLLRTLVRDFGETISYKECIKALYNTSNAPDNEEQLKGNLHKVKARLQKTLQQETMYTISTKREVGFKLKRQTRKRDQKVR